MTMERRQKFQPWVELQPAIELGCKVRKRESLIFKPLDGMISSLPGPYLQIALHSNQSALSSLEEGDQVRSGKELVFLQRNINYCIVIEVGYTLLYPLAYVITLSFMSGFSNNHTEHPRVSMPYWITKQLLKFEKPFRRTTAIDPATRQALRIFVITEISVRHSSLCGGDHQWRIEFVNAETMNNKILYSTTPPPSTKKCRPPKKTPWFIATRQQPLR